MKQYTFLRKGLIHELETYLIGPRMQDEILGKNIRPMQFYLTGKLVPFGSTSDVINERDNAIETHVQVSEEKIDEQLTLKKLFRSSTMGISFKLKKLTTVEIEASWAIYEDKEHKRLPQAENWKIDLSNQRTGTLENLNESKYGKVRYTVNYRNNLYHVNIFLMNSLKRENQYPEQDEVMFQSSLKVHIPTIHVAKFTSKADQYHVQNELLYRDKEEIAIGHGVGVDWKTAGNITTIYSTWMPRFELPNVEHCKIENQSFKMKDLSEYPVDILKEKLSVIPSAYKLWLNHETKIVNELPDYLKSEAEQNILKVKNTIERLEEGISLVTKSNNSLYYLAFQFANRAMLLQRAQSGVAQTYRTTGERIKPTLDGEWRLFQLIFLLMNVAGISDEQHIDREIVDLIWFPTGGGKTEAYLGVAAYVMAYRRLLAPKQVDKYAGITVFMRYTLRLLTTQQFQRAAALICAAEVLRKPNANLFGEEPFSIGLWIGQDSSPNKFADAMDKLEQLRDGKEVKTGNPIQLINCPWCGAELGPDQYEINKNSQKICCSNKACAFKHGIPVYTVDEAIYLKLPTLLIGTVDKIAQLPWKQDMHELFGNKNVYHRELGFKYTNSIPRGYSRINRLKPPELIIQDELHLISGPLGSLTGLYEVATDLLTRNNGRPAKVIASTATISGADEQIRALYGREMQQFPLAVQKANDNFVSKEVPTSEKPGRCYVGICAPGVSNKIQAIQTYSAYATITRSEPKFKVDPYYTMLGYFNTVKELASMVTTFKDEVNSRLNMLDPTNKFEHDLAVEELTSRKKAQEIPQLLTQMEKTLDEAGVLDAVLATNMISVGVDVDRLGTMFVQGQPKTTSEYIQATSRVGRKYPGVVFVLLNSLRSRDLSHFERFKAYHQALYRHVETMSVTPFAKGALYKGLTGTFIGFMRQTIMEINAEQSPKKIVQLQNKVDTASVQFLERVQNANGATIENEVKDLLEWWRELAWKHAEDTLAYKESKYVKAYLLKNFNEEVNVKDARPAMMSLRNVEAVIEIEVLKS
ncbi:DISARM system helicase DrmA [Bacillus pumilus]|uniref:DISARM system helicase DrmA n=1 Tax=Bacillus TaxID=1386 RepID=UPI001CB94F37|nr:MULTISPECIES: DISARM system helicase DrmA [Bacillus]MDF2003813.1 DISARM system helicase DrmA [Bacillus pumilus]MDF2024856.1 DISARM system helicase DrmA [Bacillus pumilus]MDF2028694.1 DISARM system helicase DrmA [Bacillus pumilus]MDF2089741.1 DISARM system helicase DrmA [Bacillus pumilus]